ncbi:MAG: protein tyrosine phosphatase [Polyangiaceae bacterium]
MRRFVDLHCHFVPGIDDGARSTSEARRLLEGLGRLGFEMVVATPHMRPGLFDNDAAALKAAYEALQSALTPADALPRIALSSEHYFDDVVFSRILAGQALPYPGGRAILLEFYESEFPFTIDQRLADLTRRQLTPVIAHPERYRPISKDPEILERLIDVGAEALLDLAALSGKYGRRARKTAEALLERGLYVAACSDAHRPEDIAEVAHGIEWISKRYGDELVFVLLDEGPRSLLVGPPSEVR